MKKKIYTSGKMSGLTKKESMIWRTKIETLVQRYTSTKYSIPEFLHPPMFYNYDEQNQKCEREIFDWEISNVIDSDIIVLNLDGVKESIGTHMELGAIASANKLGKNIFVVAVGKIPNDLHPWIESSWLRHEEELEDAAKYIATYLLV